MNSKRLAPCKVCGEEISKSANVCPHCGENLVFRKPGVWVGIILWCVALFCFFKACDVISEPFSPSQIQNFQQESNLSISCWKNF